MNAARKAAAVLAVVGVVASAYADPPDLPTIPQVIGFGSVSQVIAAAGVTALLVAFIYIVGFALVKRLVNRALKAAMMGDAIRTIRPSVWSEEGLQSRIRRNNTGGRRGGMM